MQYRIDFGPNHGSLGSAGHLTHFHFSLPVVCGPFLVNKEIGNKEGHCSLFVELLPGKPGILGLISNLPKIKKKARFSQTVVAHTFNPSPQETEASRSL